MKKDYGYKVCYRKQGKAKWRIYVVVNTYNFALWHVRWYEKKTPKDRKTNEPITQVTWEVFPIKNYLEYKYLWRGCPF
ncbi:MAG: hypothetical protein NC183_06920 [Corallococcus sp.]|nr:hypothetical protein [Corallococcus sp.]